MIWIDYVIAGIVMLSVLLGLWRGLVREALSLAAWVLAFWLALRFSPYLADRLAGYVPIPAVQTGIAFVVVFLLTLMVLGLLNWFIVKLVHSAGLGVPDRLLGMLFGALRGVLLATVIVVLVDLTPFGKQPEWVNSVTAGYCRQVAASVGNWLPEGAADRWLGNA